MNLLSLTCVITVLVVVVECKLFYFPNYDDYGAPSYSRHCSHHHRHFDLGNERHYDFYPRVKVYLGSFGTGKEGRQYDVNINNGDNNVKSKGVGQSIPNVIQNDHSRDSTTEHSTTNQEISSTTNQEFSSTTNQDFSSATNQEFNSATNQEFSSTTNREFSSTTGQELSSTTDQELTANSTLQDDDLEITQNTVRRGDNKK